MDGSLERLSADELRKLLIQETREYIDRLGKSDFNELETQRLRLREINRLLDENALISSSLMRWKSSSDPMSPSEST